MALSDEQRRKICDWVKVFVKDLERPEWRQFEEDREFRLEFFQRDVPSRLATFSVADLEEILRSL